MKRPMPLNHERVRAVPASFSWIDRGFITRHFIAYLSKDEITLYYFLVSAADRNGMSFYSPGKLCYLAGLSLAEFHAARKGLEEMDLILYRYPFFQVLSLPEKPQPTRQALLRVMERKVESDESC